MKDLRRVGVERGERGSFQVSIVFCVAAPSLPYRSWWGSEEGKVTWLLPPAWLSSLLFQIALSLMVQTGSIMAAA